MDHKSHFLKKAEKSFFSFFIKNTKTAFLIAIGVMIWGASALLTVPKESAPQIDYGIIHISTFYDGASAVDIDQLVTQEIENKVKEVSEINKINSNSRNSYSSITLELDPNADVGKTLNDVRSKVDEAKAKLPEDAETPTITEISSSNEAPLFDIHLAGNLHPALLRDYAEKLKRYLEGMSAVNSVSIAGGAEREIFVDIDPVKLEQFGLSVNDVTQAIRSSHKDSPIGDLKINDLEYSLRIQGRHKDAEDVRDIVITVTKSLSQQSSPVFVSDIAEVYETSEELASLEAFTEKEHGERLSTVKLSVGQTKNKDIFRIDPQVRADVRNFVQEHFGDTVEVYFTNETLDNVIESYSNVLNSGTISVFIVIVILILFIGVRESLVAGLVIPLSFLTTIAVTNAMGNTLNFMVNFSMILALGILVDTAIVIVEGIHEGIQRGLTTKEAAMAAVMEFKAPLISGMLTTLAVFIPLFTLPGIMGKYLSYIPISVSITLAASLFFALFIIPAIASKFMKTREERKASRDNCKYTRFWVLYERWHEKKLKQFSGWYERRIERMLFSRALRMFSIYAVIIGMLLSFMLPIKFTMFPADDFDILMAYVTGPEGAIKESILEKTLPVEQDILEEEEIETIETSISGNQAQIMMTLIKKDIREELGMRTSIQMAEDLRNKFKKYTNYEVVAREISNGPPSAAPVAFKIIVDDPDLIPQAQQVAEDFKEILKSIPGSDDVKDDIVNIPGEMSYRINREEALRLGVNPDLIAIAARTALEGVTATTITRSGREVDITVRYKDNAVHDFNDIDNIQIPNNNGDFISLSQLVTKELSPALSEIKRSDRRISIQVSSQLTKDGNALEITNAFNELVADYDMPLGISIEDAGENADNSELFIALAFGFVMAIFMIFAILVVQFNSYSHPFIIIFTIVMSLLGVNFGLFITDTPRSLAFIIGVISLAGIVVNDAIILVDRINVLREQYPEKTLKEIIAFAGATRLQPIILTTLTTAAGIFPLVFVSTFWAGLAYTIIFGLAVASSLTLFVTPALYYQMEKENGRTFLPIPLFIGAVLFIAGIFSFSIPQILIGALLTWFCYRKLRKPRLQTI